jgi:hypothetical protein
MPNEIRRFADKVVSRPVRLTALGARRRWLSRGRASVSLRPIFRTAATRKPHA